MKLLLYLLQVSACSGLFYLFYYLVLRKLTFFALNRWYLLVSLLVSFAVPLVTIPIDSPVQADVTQAAITAADIAESLVPTQVVPVLPSPTVPATMATAPAGPTIEYGSLLVLAYMSVAGILLLHLLFSLLVIMYRLIAETAEKRGAIKLIRNSRSFKTGSFFNYVFITDKDLTPEEREQVLAHETVHVKKLHSIDKLLAGFGKVVLWFNPFAYAYAVAVDANHEYEVDSYITADAAKKPYAELLLRLAMGETKLYHHFSKLPLQKRITMLYHIPSGKMKKLAYLFVLPLMAVALFAFAQRKAETTNQANASQQEIPVSTAVADSRIDSVPPQQEQTFSQAAAPEISIDKKVKVPKVIAVPEPQKASIQNYVVLTDYNQVKKIQPGQTTLDEIQKLFGKPSRTEVVEDINRWLFEVEQGRLFVAFDNENKVAGFSYSMKKPSASPNPTAEKARQIKLNASTEAEILKTFGQPSDVSITGRLPDNAAIMLFRYPSSQPNTSLSVQFFNRGAGYIVSNYTYKAQKYEPVIIYPDKVTDIENGKTTITEIEKKFGEPNAKGLYGNGEIWMYNSEISYLELRFKHKEGIDAVVLDNYRYERIDKD